MQYKGASGYRSFPRDIQSDWKPVLVFEKPGERRLGGQYPHDVVKAMARDVDNKERHRWGQDEGAFRELLAKFADPGMTICDPFVGGTLGRPMRGNWGARSLAAISMSIA